MLICGRNYVLYGSSYEERKPVKARIRCYALIPNMKLVIAVMLSLRNMKQLVLGNKRKKLGC